MKYQIRKSCFETNSSSMHSLIITKKDNNKYMTQKEIREEFYLDEDWYKERYKNDEKEIIKIDPLYNDYGRSPFTVLTSFRDKLTYAVAEYCGNNYSPESYIKADEIFDELFNPLLINLIGCDEVKWNKFSDTYFIIYSDVEHEYLCDIKVVPYEKMIYVNKNERNDISKDSLIRGCYKNVDKDGRPIEVAWFDVPDFGSIDHQSMGLLKSFLKRNDLSLKDYLIRKDIVVVIDGDEYCELDNLIECGLINKDSIVLRHLKHDTFDICEENENENTD